jgi:hypothetical protein
LVRIDVIPAMEDMDRYLDLIPRAIGRSVGYYYDDEAVLMRCRRRREEYRDAK